MIAATWLRLRPPPVNRPRRDDIELFLRCVLREPVECRALVAALCAADAMVDVLLDDGPAALLRHPHQVRGGDDRPYSPPDIIRS